MSPVPKAVQRESTGTPSTVSTVSFIDLADRGPDAHPARLRGLTREVRSGTYHPRTDDVAERVMAWLAPAPGVVAH